MGIGLELDEGLVEVEGVSASWRSVCPFTVEAGADGLPAGGLVDMGRTFGKAVEGDRDPFSACDDDSPGTAGGRVRKARSDEGKQPSGNAG
jgi:hypothetical protein